MLTFLIAAFQKASPVSGRAGRVQQCEVGRLRGSPRSAAKPWTCRIGPAWSRAEKQDALSQGKGEREVKKIRAGIQRSLHCRCGRGKVLALGMCATCYTLKRQDEDYSAVCGSRFSSVTAIPAGYAEPRAGESARSWFIIGCRASHDST